MNQINKNQKRAFQTFRIFSKAGMFQDYKACPNCGQNEFPFKKGVCAKCGKQIGDVQYVLDPQQYVQTNYGDVKIGIKRMYQGLDEK